jgi:hypothetical protein
LISNLQREIRVEGFESFFSCLSENKVSLKYHGPPHILRCRLLIKALNSGGGSPKCPLEGGL